MLDYKKMMLDVLSRHSNDSKWSNALFHRVKSISNTKVGSVGQDFIEELCKKLKISYEYPKDEKGKRITQSSWDMRINGVAFEIKTATEDINGGFQFNHIRYHRKYDALLCLGISTNDVFFNVWSKADVTTGKAGALVSMEKQANASFKLTKKIKDLSSISEFYKRIKKLKL